MWIHKANNYKETKVLEMELVNRREFGTTEELKNQYENDPIFGQVIAKLRESTGVSLLPYKLHELKGNQLCIAGESLREQIIQELHANGLGHFGRDKTMALVANHYY